MRRDRVFCRQMVILVIFPERNNKTEHGLQKTILFQDFLPIFLEGFFLRIIKCKGIEAWKNIN